MVTHDDSERLFLFLLFQILFLNPFITPKQRNLKQHMVMQREEEEDHHGVGGILVQEAVMAEDPSAFGIAANTKSKMCVENEALKKENEDLKKEVQTLKALL